MIRIEKNDKDSCTRNFSPIDIHYFTMKYWVDSNGISIAYCRIEHIIADLFTKSLHGELFVNFCEVIMGLKHINNLQMGPPLTKECVGDTNKFESRKKVIQSNAETKDKKVGRDKSYTDIVIHRNKKRHDVRKESIRFNLIKNEGIHLNYYSTNNNANVRSHCNPSDM